MRCCIDKRGLFSYNIEEKEAKSMAEVHYDNSNLPPEYRFIRVISENGVFYDLLPKAFSRSHLFALRKQYYSAEPVIRAHVPPCICRDFTHVRDMDAYEEAVWKNGRSLLLPLEPKDQLLIYDIKQAANRSVRKKP